MREIGSFLQSGGDDGYYNCEEIPFFEMGSVHHEEYLVNLRLPYVKANQEIGKVQDIHFVVSCSKITCSPYIRQFTNDIQCMIKVALHQVPSLK